MASIDLLLLLISEINSIGRTFQRAFCANSFSRSIVNFTHLILLNITEEDLSEYFQSLASSAPVVSDGYLIDDHFSHVEQFMSVDVPFYLAMLKSIRLSFAKLAKAPTISNATPQLLNHIRMTIADLIFNHNMHQRRYHFVVANLEQLRQLQTQKSTYTANFQATRAERQADLVK